MLETPSPEWGVFRWAWYCAKEYRARFWVSAAVFSLIVALIVSRLPLPPHPTANQNLIATSLAIIGATVLTGIGSYACALVAAPFQQRNALRNRLAGAESTIAALQAVPVPKAHGDRLRQIAAQLRACVQDYAPLHYGDDAATWRRAFHEHFPDLRSGLDKAHEADVAFETFKERLQKEITEAGMDTLPWTSTEFLPWLATTVQARAIQNIIGITYTFEWQELGQGNVYIGDPVYRSYQILRGCDLADVPAREHAFEEFFEYAESWPETAAVRSKWDQRTAAEETAIELLATAMNTDPITTRCFLCRGSGA